MNGPPTEDVIEGATKTIEYAVQDLTDQLRKLESAIESLQITVDRLMKENEALYTKLNSADREIENLRDQLSLVS